MRALLAVAGALALAPAAHAADEVVVTDDSGARAVITKAPFRIAFQDAAGNTVLRHVENAGLPGAEVNVDNEGIGLDNVPETAHYSPLTFQVGADRQTQHPGGLWTGNMLIGARAGVVHAATEVVGTRRLPKGVELDVATTDPARKLVVRVTGDKGSALRVRAQLDVPHGVTAFADSFESQPGEAFHGFGGRHNTIDQRGEDFYNWIEEEAFGAGPLRPLIDPAPGSGGDRYLFPNGPQQAYYVQNLFVSSRPYGFLLNHTELSRWRMAADRDDAWQVNVRDDRLDYTVAVGDGPSAIGSLTRVNGRHRVAPEWAMGPAVKRNVQQGNSDPARQQALILADLERIERGDVRLEAYAYESWDTLPRAFVRDVNARLEALGVKQIGYVRAYVNDDGNFDPPGTFQDAVQRGLVAETPGGAPWVSVAVGPAALLDFTNPATRSWWWDRKIGPMMELGFDGFMQDFGEQALDDMVFHDGSTGVEMHNRYPTVFHRATRRLLDRNGFEDVWMYTRSGFSGRKGSAHYESSNFPGDETADWQPALGLPALAPDMLNRAVGGAYGFSTDIGGYFDSYTDGSAGSPLDDELFTRWMEWSVFTPHFRVHNSCCSNGTQMPWRSDAMLARWNKLADLHVRARPYIRRQWERAVATGMPPIRPLWLAAPGDAQAAEQDQQWMVGDDLLVAPVVTKGATAREVYFPAGCWTHGERGDTFTGPARATVAAALGELPWFERCGTDPVR